MANEATFQPFYVDRAKGGRAACKGCKTKCPDGELRIAKIVPSPYGDNQQMKSWYHVDCLMTALLKQRPTTKRIDCIDDVGNWATLSAEDQKYLLDKINKTEQEYAEKHSGKYTAKTIKNVFKPVEKTVSKFSMSPTKTSEIINDDKFSEFIKLCGKIAKVDAYTEKTAIVNNFFQKGSKKDKFRGDLNLWCKMLLPQVSKRVYNLKSKQLVKLFSRIFNADHDDMLTHLEQGDVADTIQNYYSKHKTPAENSILSIQDVDKFLQELSTLTKEDEQIYHFKKIVKQCTLVDLKMLIRLIKGDLRINAGPKHILEGVHPDAYSVFQTSRDLDMVLDRVMSKSNEVKHRDALQHNVQAQLSLMTPVLPMLAEACKSVEMAMKKCPNGMFSEIKYDGERVQVHKKRKEFRYFSRALKPVMSHKVNHFEKYLPQAFPEGEDLVLDAEVLMVDVKSGQPLPFGTLGIHKQSEFKDAQVCLFVFDCLYYNGEILLNIPLKKRREILLKHMIEIKNHVMFSEQELINKPEDLAKMISKVLKLGLEGLVLKDVMSKYEPGKRHWLKVKKDYLFGGAMADKADLVVLGAWFGTGKKGGMMSVFLMGCHDTRRDRWVTVTKVHTGHDDNTLERLQDELGPLMVKISQDHSCIPKWLDCNKGLVPDFIAKDPKNQPVWEITGTEFTKAHIHTANGISVRFPRVSRIRTDKDWKTANNLKELEHMYETSKEKFDDTLLMNIAGTSSKDKIGNKNQDEDERSHRKNKSKSEKESPVIKEEKQSPKVKTKHIDTYFTKETPKKDNIEKSPKKLKVEHDENLKNSSIISPETTSKHKARKRTEDDESPTKKMKIKSEKAKETNQSPESKPKATDSNKASAKKVNVISLKDFKLENLLPDLFLNLKLAFYPDFISFEEEERDEFERHWIAFGGEVVKSIRFTSVDYVIHKDDRIKFKDMAKLTRRLGTQVRHVTKYWLNHCINERSLCDPTAFPVFVEPSN